MTSLTEAAVECASLGFSVFPAKRTLKRIKGEWKTMKIPNTFHGHLQASTDPEIVREMFEGTHASIKPWCSDNEPDILGMLHDQFLVIDVDVKHDKPGLKNFEEKVRPHLPKPLAQVVTASGGFHWYYPPPPKEVFKKRSTDFLPGVDLLIGKGWFAVPPSQGYRFVTGSMESVRDALYREV